MRKLGGSASCMNKNEFLKNRSEFLKRLHKKEREIFIKAERHCVKKRNKIWENVESRKELEIRGGIRKNQEHDRYLNLCIFPFIQIEKSELFDYRFIRAEPLVELNPEEKVKNFDFLIYNGKNVAIFGEMKRSISNAMNVLNELKERIEEVKKREGYIKLNYLKTKKDVEFEFVVAIPSEYAEDMVNAIYRNEERIIVWSIHVIEELKEISVPRKYRLRMARFMSNEEAERLRLIHKDKNLRRLLGRAGGIETQMETPFQVFPSSSSLKYLRTFSQLIEIRGREKELKKEKIIDFFYEKEFTYLCSPLEREERNNEFINNKIESMIEKAIEIDFIEATDQPGVFSVKTRSTKKRDIEKNTLEPKYIKYKLNKKKEDFKRKNELKCFEELKEKVEKDFKVQTILKSQKISAAE